MNKTLVNPKQDLPLYDNWRYSQAVRTGNFVWMAGQVGIDSDHQPAAGMKAQAELVFENMKRVLGEVGGTLEDVVEMTTFHIDLRGEFAEFVDVKNRFFTSDFPAWTSVGVTELALPELRVEVRAMAVLKG